MPPISPQGSRGGLITAVVIFAILFVTSTIFAFIYSARATRSEEDLRSFRLRYNGIVAESNLQGPEIEALKAAKDAPASGFGPNDTALTVALGQTRQVATLLSGKPDVTAATATARQALNSAKDKLKGVQGVTIGNDLASAVSTLADAIVAREGQIAQLTTQRDATAAEVTAAKQQQEAMVAANATAVQEARDQAAATAAAAQTDRSSKDEQVAQIEAEREAERTRAAANTEALNTQIAERDSTVKNLQSELKRIRDRIALLRGNVTNAVIGQADGTIIRLPGNNIAYIGLGAGDQIAPGLTFEVYDKSEGVPIPSAESNDLPQGKASLEVLRVGSTSSECRITRTTPGEQLTEGDLIANLVYDRNTRYAFYIYGNFDLDQNGVSTPGDANVIKQLITQWGGRVGDQINVNTDFVVIGAEPVVPNFTEEERADPVNQKKYEDAQAELNTFQEILNRAGELNIPVLNQNRFLYYVGYYDQARR
ncbi:MAG TPA: hypothetical protein VGN72_23515 [Tepidisphaeraceae bacterium]|jgi:hypothetical protein|nr:hypothetical protein [Tepidisphaeraceae bacterium]